MKFLRRFFRKTPQDYLLDDYEVLIRLARRCAYDLRHVVRDLPADSHWKTDFQIEKVAEQWVELFAKGNPGKNYRIELQQENDSLRMNLERLYAWMDEKGIVPPFTNPSPF